MEEKIVRVFLRRYEKIGYKGGIAKVIFDDEFEDMAHEIVKLFSIPYVSNSEVALKAFVEEFVEAWEDGMGGDTDLYKKAKSLL